jgi:hypothetical protein
LNRVVQSVINNSWSKFISKIFNTTTICISMNQITDVSLYIKLK